MEITKRKRLFVESYVGDEVEAMRYAGYEGTDGYLRAKAAEMLRDPDIQEAIKIRSQYLASTYRAVATRAERQAMWTAIMRNEDPHRKPEVDAKGVSKIEENIPMSMRLKASELLGKSETDFVERIDINTNITITDIIQESYAIPADDIDAIEAEYTRIYEQKKLTAAQKNPPVQDVEIEQTPKVESFI